MKSKIKNMDKFLFLLTIIYTILGLVMVFSASSMTAVLQYNKSESYFFMRQLMFIIAGYFCGLFIIFMPYSLVRFAKKCSKILIFISVALLLLTMAVGVNRNGVTSWLDIGPTAIQPSEFVKTFVILFLAFTFRNSKKVFKNDKFLISFAAAIFCSFLIFLQPDFGTSMILGIIIYIMFMFIPKKDNIMNFTKKVSFIIVLLGIFTFVFGGEFLTKNNVLKFNKEQLSRFVYNNPCSRYTEKTGYQVCNGYIAINNGGLFGVGLGNSKQKYLYLPEAYTDFVFPIIIEELGSVVSSIIIIGFIVMLCLLLKIARQSETITGSLLAIGTFAYILSHLLINLLGVTALIPLTGVPLPFLSYGGSFNFNLIILLFICERVSIESKNRKLKREIESL